MKDSGTRRSSMLLWLKACRHAPSRSVCYTCDSFHQRPCSDFNLHVVASEHFYRLDARTRPRPLPRIKLIQLTVSLQPFSSRDWCCKSYLTRLGACPGFSENGILPKPITVISDTAPYLEHCNRNLMKLHRSWLVIRITMPTYRRANIN